MTAFRLVRGQHLIYRGIEFLVDGRLPDGRCMLRTPCHTDAAILGEDEMRTALGSGELRFVRCEEIPGSATGSLLKVDYSGLPERYKARAERSYAYLKAFAEKAVRAYTRETLSSLIVEVATQINDLHPPSWITAYRWHRRFEAAGRDIRALVPSYAYRGSNNPRMPDEVLDISERCVEKYWCGQKRSSVAGVHREITDAITKANKRRMPDDQLPMVSSKYVYRLIDRLDLYTWERARNGPRAAWLKFSPRRAVPDPARPNAIVEIDHTVVNVFVVDDQTGFPLGRPWLTVALDRATRMIVGFHIGFDPPSYDVVAACLRTAILPKDHVKRDYPLVERSWDAWGQIERILVDRALEFRSEPLKDSCKVLDIAINWTPRRKPWHKGKVERFMRTIGDDLFHRLPGAARPLAQRWDEEQPWKNARITLQGLRLLVHLWVIDYYCQKPHSGIGNRTPAARWNELTGLYPITPFFSRDDLDILLGRLDEASISNQGIRLEGLRYQSDFITGLLIRPNSSKRVKLKLSESVEQIYVLDPWEGCYHPVPIAREFAAYAEGLTWYQHRVIARHAREATESSTVTIQTLAQSRARIEEIGQQLCRRASRGAHAKLARYFSLGNNPTESVKTIPAPWAGDGTTDHTDQLPQPRVQASPVRDSNELDQDYADYVQAQNWPVRTS